MIFRFIKKILVSIIDNVLLLFVKTRNNILFIPHRGFYASDNASIRNFRSDNALTYLRYLLDNNLYTDYNLIVASSIFNNRVEEEIKFISEYYPHRKIKIIDFFDLGIEKSLCERIRRKKIILSSKAVISSEPHYISLRNKRQLIICASYYPAPFKSDFIPKDSPYFMNYAHECSFFDYFISNSKLASHLDSSSSGLSFDKYLNIGQCRLDNFAYDCDEVREGIKCLVSYPVKHIILYTPTHRDYESNTCDSRSLLGFKYEKKRLEEFIKRNNILVICKLHPKQNSLVVDNTLPYGVVNFRGNPNYGLTELMLCADLLITDYTSGYYEYLLLNKPVIFNFYDYSEYKESRGFVVDSIKELCAGDIIYDERTFYDSLNNYLYGQGSSHTEHRRFVKNLFFEYQDSNSCQRLYEFIDANLCKSKKSL